MTDIVAPIEAILADLQALVVSHAHLPTVKPVDPACPNKHIPFLMQVGTPAALELKQRIILASAVSRGEQKLQPVKGLPADFPYYPSVPSDGAENLDWGKLHPGNRNWSLGHKVDGSNLTVGIEQGNVIMTCGSKACTDSAGFKEAKRSLTMLRTILNPGLAYHFEFVGRLRHNVVVYERLPRHLVVVFDIQDRATKRWFTEQEIADECARTGLEQTDIFWDNATRTGTCAFLVDASNSTDGYVDDPVAFAKLVLQAIADGRVRIKMGGTAEGAVLKHRSYYNVKKGVTVCKKRKFVTSDFKEIRRVKQPTPPLLSVRKHFEWIGSLFDVPARFRKAFQRLRDSDLSYEEQVRLALGDDHGYLTQSLDQDFYKEARDEVMQYVVGDFRMRCVRAQPDDLDLGDALLPMMQTFKTEDDVDGMWEAIRGHVAAYARASFLDWRSQHDVQQWIAGMFA